MYFNSNEISVKKWTTLEENDLKRCCKDGIILLKSNISKDNSTKDKVYPSRGFCANQKQKVYNSKKREKMNGYHENYIKQRRQTDVNFCLIHNSRSRIYKAPKGNVESIPAEKKLGIEIDICRSWI